MRTPRKMTVSHHPCLDAEANSQQDDDDSTPCKENNTFIIHDCSASSIIIQFMFHLPNPHSLPHPYPIPNPPSRCSSTSSPTRHLPRRPQSQQHLRSIRIPKVHPRLASIAITRTLPTPGRRSTSTAINLHLIRISLIPAIQILLSLHANRQRQRLAPAHLSSLRTLSRTGIRTRNRKARPHLLKVRKVALGLATIATITVTTVTSALGVHVERLHDALGTMQLNLPARRRARHIRMRPHIAEARARGAIRHRLRSRTHGILVVRLADVALTRTVGGTGTDTAAIVRCRDADAQAQTRQAHGLDIPRRLLLGRRGAWTRGTTAWPGGGTHGGVLQLVLAVGGGLGAALHGDGLVNEHAAEARVLGVDAEVDEVCAEDGRQCVANRPAEGRGDGFGGCVGDPVACRGATSVSSTHSLRGRRKEAKGKAVQLTLGHQRAARDRVADFLQPDILVEHLRRRRLRAHQVSFELKAPEGSYSAEMDRKKRTETYLAIPTTLEQRRRAHQPRIIVPEHRVRLSLPVSLLSVVSARHAERILKDLEEVAARSGHEHALLAVVGDVASIAADLGRGRVE